jgi:Conjugative transposon, TraM/Domain of unknown function (DUF4138)
MKQIITNLSKRKFLLLLSAVLVAFCCMVFFWFGGGKVARRGKDVVAGGLNKELPRAIIDGKQLLNKKLQYEQAARDSLRKAQFQRQDPYRRDTSVKLESALGGRDAMKDPRAEQLLRQLDQLKASLHRPQAEDEGHARTLPAFRSGVRSPYQGFHAFGGQDDTTGDAKVGQLNAMLDKVIRIQHPEEGHSTASASRPTDEVLPADSSVNTIAAVMTEDQTLTAGATIALRITDSIRVNGRALPTGQLVYGVVTINNDRMLIHIGSLRDERSLFTTDLQVYDMDGIEGVHIPGVLSRDVAKQSADQGVNSMNVLSVDPSLGAQAANAGIQTAKTFIGRKVKQVRVSVRAGYQVLLRNAHPKATTHGLLLSGVKPLVEAPPPTFAPEGAVLTRARSEGVELALQGIALDSGRLWFRLEWSNHSPIGYTAAYTRWYIRDRKQFKRTAMQELPLEPFSGTAPPTVISDSSQFTWTGFNPFTIAKDKELVLEAGEKGGGRMLELVIKHKQLLNARNYGKETRKDTDTTGDRAL